MEEKYKPEVPAWVASILTLDRKRRINQYSGSIASGKEKKAWDEWKRRYSRKLKYARLNGWTIEPEKRKVKCLEIRKDNFIQGKTYEAFSPHTTSSKPSGFYVIDEDGDEYKITDYTNELKEKWSWEN